MFFQEFNGGKSDRLTLLHVLHRPDVGGLTVGALSQEPRQGEEWTRQPRGIQFG